MLYISLRKRYWRESTFKGIDLVRSALDEVYGAGKVSLVSAAFRWLTHHSQMKPEFNGEWQKDMSVEGGCELTDGYAHSPTNTW